MLFCFYFHTLFFVQFVKAFAEVPVRLNIIPQIISCLLLLLVPSQLETVIQKQEQFFHSGLTNLNNSP